jgi:hypothetical protein
MADYALFLKCAFNKNGNFHANTRQTRHPDRRFWSEVATSTGGVISTVGNSSNADTTSMQMTARTTNTDRVYFAVAFTPGGQPPQLNRISIMCAINPVVVGNNATVASPFRDPNDNTKIQLFFFAAQPFKTIISGSDAFMAIGPFDLNRDPDPQIQVGDCCFHKLTLVVNATRGPDTEDFSYDPDMDIEMGL